MALLPLLHMSDSSPVSAALLGLSGTFRAAVKKKKKKKRVGRGLSVVFVLHHQSQVHSNGQ